MLKSSARTVIRLRGVRQNNLKNFDLDLPLNQLIVVTGLSGSGKSSLAFDTLFAEGQRRYIETFSPYARQFLDRMDKPQADSIEGIPPAIAIEQRNAVKTTRSTVGTMTELCDHLKMLWPHIAQLHCRQCGRPVRKDAPQAIWESLEREGDKAKSEKAKSGKGEANARSAAVSEYLITFDLPLTEKLSLEESLALVAKQGYQRLLLNGEVVRLDEAVSRLTLGPARSTHGPGGPERHESPGPRPSLVAPKSIVAPKQSDGRDEGGPLPPSLTVIQDRLRLTTSSRARFIEACEQAYHFGKGKLAIREVSSTNSKLKTQNSKLFSNRLHCAECDIEYREPTSALFSFNHPVGACPKCRGFGRVISIDYDLALPDRSRTLAQGVVKPWRTGQGAECHVDLMRMCRHFEIPTNVPFEKLPKKWQDFVIDGEPDYGKDEEHEWPRAWYGIKGYFRWLESRAYKMHVRVLLSRYRAYTTCPDCAGQRFQPEALLYRVDGLTLAGFYQLPIRDALRFVDGLARQHQLRPNEPLGIVLGEVRARLRYLNEVGLGYLTLDRPTRTLSGGETERVNLTTCLGTRLVNTLFVLDEPSVGLHPRDTERLVHILQQLRDAENTVVVVEHEANVMRAANQIVDLGPGHGATGGQVVFQGTYPGILKSNESLTGQYLSGRKQIEIPERRPVRLKALSATAAPVKPQRRDDRRDRGHATSASIAPLRFNRGFYESAVETSALHEAPAPLGSSLETSCLALRLSHATRHNLKDLTVEIPLGRFVCVTGVSGSGKTTLVREVLLPALVEQLKSTSPDTKASDRLASDQNGDEGDATPPPESPPSSPATRHPPLLSGAEHLGRVVLVDQSILGKTPRSNPAVYIGAFDDIREFFAESELAKQRGLNASAFSFNSAQGQCERCRGAGFEKIEMQFLSDVFIRCPDCDGRRYREHILEVTVSPEPEGGSAKCEVRGASPAPRLSSLLPQPSTLNPQPSTLVPRLSRRSHLSSRNEASAETKADPSHLAPCPPLVAPKSPIDQERSVRREEGGSPLARHPSLALSIADLLDSTVEEAIDFLQAFPESRPARRAAQSLKLLVEVGLGYLKLGQPINTLSGGESQRLKLVRHLAEAIVGDDVRSLKPSSPRPSLVAPKSPIDQKRSVGGDEGGPLPPLPSSLPAASSPTLFLFDEPTTGLHFDDVRVLLKVFQRLVDAGHSVIVIEHNLDVLKSADWLIDLGPDAGDEGGRLVAQGTPEDVAACEASHTGRALREVLRAPR